MRRILSLLLTIGLIAVLASSASAAPLFGAKTIDVRKNGGEWHLAEILAFETGTGINVAEQSNGGVASVTVGSSQFGTIPGDANDGNLDQSFGGGSVWHSGNTPGETMRFELAAPTDLDSIDLLGRTDCCQNRDDDLTVTIYDELGAEIFTADVGIPDAGQRLSFEVDGGTPPVVPEPASIAIWSILGLCLAGYGYRRRRQNS